MSILYLPFILQGLVMLVDEFYFHEKRGLPRWERFGHPLDTLTVLGCFLYLLTPEPSMAIYYALCAFSCVFITKDEFVHAEKCNGAEHWLHSLLFMLHPLCFFMASLLVQAGDVEFLNIQTIILGVFMFYQILRWSIPWRIPQK